ncbi:MAG: pyridoxal phosphate-dependent aminotransferase [Candidatus Levyibacteriota bacterium]
MPTLIKKYDFEKLEFLMFVLDEIADELVAKGKDVIKLTLGKAQEPLHEDIIEAYIDAIRDPEKRNVVYPQGLPALRNKIAEWYTNWDNPLKAANIIINTGTSPLFKDLFRFLLQKGDEVLLPHPYYSVYYISALLTPAKIKFYKIDPKTLQIDMNDFKKKYNPKKTKLVVLCSPGNPYGNTLSKKNFTDILDVVDGNAYVLSDEIYRNVDFYGNAPSILDVVRRKKDKVIVSNAFSKGFRMYTTRVGFFILPDEMVEPFRVLLQHTLLTTNPSAQYACIEALNHLDEVTNLTSIYKDRNEYSASKLANIQGIRVLKAQGGFYFVIECAGFMKTKKIKTSLDLAKDILYKTGVAVVPGSDFGIPTGLRVSFTHLRYKEAIDRMTNYFKE